MLTIKKRSALISRECDFFATNICKTPAVSAYYIIARGVKFSVGLGGVYLFGRRGSCEENDTLHALVYCNSATLGWVSTSALIRSFSMSIRYQ